MYCAPKYEKNGSVTCYNRDTLLRLCKLYNKYYPKNRIPYSNKNKKQLFEQLRNRMANRCDTEWCWLEQDFMKSNIGNGNKYNGYNKNKNSNNNSDNNRDNNSNNNEIENSNNDQYSSEALVEKFFRPKLPNEWKKNKHTWLNSYDILNVMSQYEDKYPNFQFMGPVSSDCPTEIHCELSNFNISNMLSNGITKVGIIYNLDTSKGPGTHWVSVYIDLKKCRIYYYDSYGYAPIRRIGNFIKLVVDHCKKVHCNMKFEYNKTRHQYGNSECGIYSMFVITELLKGKTFKKATELKIPDSKMNEMRFKKLYRMNNGNHIGKR